MAQNQQKPIPNPVKFAFGGLAGMGATCFVQPLDLIKNRMQMSAPGQFKNAFHCARTIIAAEGFPKLYTGFGARNFSSEGWKKGDLTL